MRAGQVARREESRIVHVEHGDGRGDGFRRREQPRQVDALAVAFPPAHRLRQQPQAHDVVQEADAPVDTALVGEVRLARGIRRHRMLQLDADESPRAARDVGGRLGPHRHGDDGGGGVVRSDRDDLDAVPGPELGRDGRAEAANRLAGTHERANTDAGRPSLLDELVVPFAGLHAEEPGRRRIRALGEPCARELEPHEIGHEQEGVGDVEASARVGQFGRELVERVERKELQAVAAVELVERRDRVHRLDATPVALVAVVERLGEHAVAAQERVVDGPGVHADRRDAGSRRNASARPRVRSR